MICHGFKTQAKFDNYLKCLMNIRMNSIVTCSEKFIINDGYNDAGTVFTVGAIIEDYTYYGMDNYISRRIILKLPIDFSSSKGTLFAGLIGKNKEKIRANLGSSAESYRYRTISASILVKRIDNSQPLQNPLGGQRFAHQKPSLNYGSFIA
jgi:hypothetical protein